jgi:hypothetical protein
MVVAKVKQSVKMILNLHFIQGTVHKLNNTKKKEVVCPGLINFKA